MPRPHLPSPPVPRSPPEGGFGLGGAAASVGAAQRAGLYRGIVFALLLAASSLASVYLPLACGGPDWVEGRAPAAAPR